MVLACIQELVDERNGFGSYMAYWLPFNFLRLKDPKKTDKLGTPQPPDYLQILVSILHVTNVVKVQKPCLCFLHNGKREEGAQRSRSNKEDAHETLRAKPTQDCILGWFIASPYGHVSYTLTSARGKAG